jgi:predicted O-methyltransferase YrrM
MINIEIDNNILGEHNISQLNFTPEFDIKALLFAFKQHKDIKNILEIGTNLGYTTKNIADNFKQSHIYTIDIYKEMGLVQSDNPCINEIPTKNEIGQQVKRCENVTQLYGNSNDYKYSDIIFDCVFIDGNHSYEGVSKDFINILDYIKKDSIIAFHDVNDNPITEGVIKFLNELKQIGINVCKVNNTWTAYIIMDKQNYALINKIKEKYVHIKNNLKEVFMNSINIDKGQLRDIKHTNYYLVSKEDIEGVYFAFKQHKKINNILEIGTCKGHTSKFLATNFPNSKIYTIDIYKDMNINDHYEQSYLTPTKNELGLECKDITHVTQLIGDSNTYNYDELFFDCIFMDGNHSYEGTSKTFINTLDNIKAGSIYAFHDVNDLSHHKGIIQFLLELIVLGIDIIKFNDCDVAYCKLTDDNIKKLQETYNKKVVEDKKDSKHHKKQKYEELKIEVENKNEDNSFFEIENDETINVENQ